MERDWTGNKYSTYLSIGARNFSKEDREPNDFYATDPIAVEKLLDYFGPYFPIYAWEPACGEGHLSEGLATYCKYVCSTDLVDRGYIEQIKTLDFLKTTELCFNLSKNEPMAIVTNPPYKYATEFVAHALDLLRNGDWCCMFLKLTFLEGKKRRALFEKYPPKKVLIFSVRVPCAKNADFEKMKKSGGTAIAFAWFIWEKGYVGETVVDWL